MWKWHFDPSAERQQQIPHGASERQRGRRSGTCARLWGLQFTCWWPGGSSGQVRSHSTHKLGGPQFPRQPRLMLPIRCESTCWKMAFRWFCSVYKAGKQRSYQRFTFCCGFLSLLIQGLTIINIHSSDFKLLALSLPILFTTSRQQSLLLRRWADVNQTKLKYASGKNGTLRERKQACLHWHQTKRSSWKPWMSFRKVPSLGKMIMLWA